MATPDPGAGNPPDNPARAAEEPVEQPATKTSRAGRNLGAAIAVGAGIGGVLIVTLLFAPRLWVPIVALAILVATHEVVRRLREAGYVIALIPLLAGASSPSG